MTSSDFRDLNELLDGDLQLPIGGRTYTVTAVDGETGLWMERLMSTGLTVAAGGEPDERLGTQLLGDKDERTLYERALGNVYQAMVDDGVAWTKIKLAGLTVLYWTTMSREVAHAFWSSGGTSLGKAPNRAARRASTSTAEATTTRTPASGSGTRSQPTRSRRSRDKRSRGGTS